DTAGASVQNVAGATGTDSGTSQQVGDTGSVTISITTNGTEIPEFPTVALPIAAILGLMFLFQRRKD
ncbi:MAG: PEF-CTERM sorting domain-containing protein, partial [ANME-2 cluster archaeon]|nr:PEF-CTERM sorting domain-containing protein [ANME-2 cluster archaeon]